MAVLSDEDIKNAIIRNEGIIILNMRKESMTGAGYDLTIGFIRDSETGQEPETYIDDPNRYVLLPGHRYLVISKEFIYLSSQYMATLHSRGSYSLKGIILPSTVIDPNYAGFIVGSLFNCTSNKVYIKKDNQFATMVIQTLRTPTDKKLQKNADGRPMDALETLHSKYPNIDREACDAADVYYVKARKQIEYEYEAAQEQIFKKEFKAISQTTLPENKQKARITFLIGNGFDLSVGLHTGYTDFYKYYLEDNKDDPLAKEIKDNINDWADLELALGKYTGNVKNKEAFWESEKILEKSLMDYLKKQAHEIDISDKGLQRKIGYKIEKSLTEFYEDFPEKWKLHISKILQDDKEVEYAFISFNYTDVLERYLETTQGLFLIKLCSEMDKTVLHIHGTLADKKIVLGVNDERQITNKEFRNNDIDRKRFIKEDIMDYYGDENKEKARTIIDNSSIICIFGMSIGATDQAWWQYIAKWLQNDKARRLIIFAKDNETHEIGKFAARCEKEMKERFKNNGELFDIWKEIEEQIYAKVNADIFNF